MLTVKHASDEELYQLYRVLASIDDPEHIKTLMEDMCTIREINEVAQRLTVAFMLDSGEPYTAIQEKTGASATTIARVSKCLNYGNGGYRQVIDRQK